MMSEPYLYQESIIEISNDDRIAVGIEFNKYKGGLWYVRLRDMGLMSSIRFLPEASVLVAQEIMKHSKECEMRNAAIRERQNLPQEANTQPTEDFYRQIGLDLAAEQAAMREERRREQEAMDAELAQPSDCEKEFGDEC